VRLIDFKRPKDDNGFKTLIRVEKPLNNSAEECRKEYVVDANTSL
jgi:hypothetical protein